MITFKAIGAVGYVEPAVPFTPGKNYTLTFTVDSMKAGTDYVSLGIKSHGESAGGNGPIRTGLTYTLYLDSVNNKFVSLRLNADNQELASEVYNPPLDTPQMAFIRLHGDCVLSVNEVSVNGEAISVPFLQPLTAQPMTITGAL